MTTVKRYAVGGAAAATRGRLYAAAAELFVEQGFEETTMSNIAERAGTSRRTAFNHFPSKSDFPMEWARRLADQALEAASGDVALAATEQIRAYFSNLSDVVELEAELSRQMILGWTMGAGPIRYESQFLVGLIPILQHGQEVGEINMSIDTRVAAHALSDLLTGATFRWVHVSEPPLRQSVLALVEVALAGITTPATE